MKNINSEKATRRAIVAGGLASTALAFVPKAPAIAQTLEKLVMLNGTAPPEPASHYFQYAIQNGFYKNHGVDLELRAISGTANALRATVAGEVDICWIDAWTGLQARDKGLKV
jgi:ABC-type nitrate/sulfonate/bicarbonate transport system substrate-binding protein